MLPSYVQRANGASLIYDITNARALSRIPYWIQIIKSNNKYNVPILLVGNKLDLENFIFSGILLARACFFSL
ncbi:MAG: hypothetical protein ACFFBI_05890 [Promethearchaeota archaeon]